MSKSIVRHCMHAQSLSCVWLFATPWTAAWEAPLSMGFSSKSTGAGCHFLLQGISSIQVLKLSFLCVGGMYSWSVCHLVSPVRHYWTIIYLDFLGYVILEFSRLCKRFSVIFWDFSHFNAFIIHHSYTEV